MFDSRAAYISHAFKSVLAAMFKPFSISLWDSRLITNRIGCTMSAPPGITINLDVVCPTNTLNQVWQKDKFDDLVTTNN